MNLTSIRGNIIETLKSLSIRVKAVAVYGSWSRDAQTPDSDIDLMITDNINPKRYRRGKEIACIKETLPGGFSFDVLLLTSQEYMANFRNHNPLISLKFFETFKRNFAKLRGLTIDGFVKRP